MDRTNGKYAVGVLLLLGIVFFNLESLWTKHNTCLETHPVELLIEPTSKCTYMESTSLTLLIPNDAQLLLMRQTKLSYLYWRYVNTIQVLCRNQLRMGSLFDGGKEICIDEKFVPQKPCLVYSFGSNFKTDFETAVIDQFGCEVHTFDPTQPLNGRTLPKGINFHLYGLHKSDEINAKKWNMRTLSSILKELNHTQRAIDILKMDIESSEWDALPQILDSGSFKNIKQLNVETHFTGGHAEKVKALGVLRMLYEYGFYIFMREHNIHCIDKNFNPPYTHCNELSLLNSAWMGTA